MSGFVNTLIRRESTGHRLTSILVSTTKVGITEVEDIRDISTQSYELYSNYNDHSLLRYSTFHSVSTLLTITLKSRLLQTGIASERFIEVAYILHL